MGQSDNGLSVTIPRGLADEIDKALTAAITNAIAFYSDEPYPDDPRWTPWTRFGKRLCERADGARKALREAIRDA